MGPPDEPRFCNKYRQDAVRVDVALWRRSTALPNWKRPPHVPGIDMKKGGLLGDPENRALDRAFSCWCRPGAPSGRGTGTSK